MYIVVRTFLTKSYILLYRSNFKISAKMRPAIWYFKNVLNTSVNCVFYMLSFDVIPSEFRECFQSLENNMEICRICFQICRYAMHFRNRKDY